MFSDDSVPVLQSQTISFWQVAIHFRTFMVRVCIHKERKRLVMSNQKTEPDGRVAGWETNKALHKSKKGQSKLVSIPTAAKGQKTLDPKKHRWQRS